MAHHILMHVKSRPARRQSGQIVALMVIVTAILGFIGGGLIDVAGAIQYHEFLLRVADSGAHAASSQSVEVSGSTVGVDAGNGQALGQGMLNPWVGINGISAVTVSISGQQATATVSGTYRPLVLSGLPGFSGISMTASRTEQALPTG